MVSTRGLKLKFYEGERVLCYEPDPTKAKVLYDSKVLEVVTNKDHRGRKSIEYLIHFQGWNSSWDRCVGEEFVLKDTPENRQLQKDLAEKSQLQFGTYLYRKERKKSLRKTNDRVTSEEDGNCSSPSRMDITDPQDQELSSSSEDESSIEDDAVPIELTPELRDILNQDFLIINTKQMLPKLPAEPNVVNILESYWKHYATNQLNLNVKVNGKYRLSFSNQPKINIDDIQKNLQVCEEIVDSLRIYFDYTVNDLLLYKQEMDQIKTMPALYSQKLCESFFKNRTDDLESLNYRGSIEDSYSHSDYENSDKKRFPKKRNLRSNHLNEIQKNGGDPPENSFASLKIDSNADIAASYNNSTQVIRTCSWKLVPEHVYYQQPKPPCLVYGAIHLTRLLVKLPELLVSSGVADDKLEVIVKHLDSFIQFLTSHREWYGENHYVTVESVFK